MPTISCNGFIIVATTSQSPPSSEDIGQSLINCVSRNGFTVLHLAVYRGDCALVDFLLSNGADPCCPGPNRFPPIHITAMCGNVEILERLKEAGSDVSSQDWVQYSPLHVASYFGHDKVSFWIFDGLPGP